MVQLNGLTISVLICLGFCAIKVNVVRAEFLTASACHDINENSCNKMTLECNAGNKIRLLTMKYGVKEGRCEKKRNRCFDPVRNGCCVYEEDDCTEYYNKLHAYQLYQNCSGKQKCQDLPVPNKMLSTCNNEVSTYVHVQYECVPASSFGDFCDGSKAGNDINLLFSSTTNSVNERSNCTCNVQSPTGVIVEYVDVRMFKENDETWASLCSSASLVTQPESSVNTQCLEQSNQHDNFIYAESWTSNSQKLDIKLNNLRFLGAIDVPDFIWLNLIGTQQVTMLVNCYSYSDFNPTPTVVPPITTITAKPDTATPGTGTTEPNSAPLDDDDSSNSGAIVAGVLIPIILILVICVVLFILWKRRGYIFKRDSTKSRSTPNTYIDNCVDEEYAEIGFVPDEPNMSPTYDAVYEPGTKPSSITGTSNGTSHTYVNTMNVDTVGQNNIKIVEPQEQKSKNLRSPFEKLKSSKDRLISYFKKQGENDFPPEKVAKRRSRDKTDESYDHLRPTSVVSGVQIELVPPVDDPKHMYSHTAGTTTGIKSNSNEIKQTVPTAKINTHPTRDEVNAVHVGDAYIEFQSGPMDKDHPDLIKVPPPIEHDPNIRPEPPSRPPPSPSNGKRKDGSSQNLVVDVSNDPVSRANSPNHLFPVSAGSRSPSPVGSDVSSIHSYKVLDPLPVYDYADLSGDELGMAPRPPDEIYEDVDGKKMSVRKHASASVLPDVDDEYLEPVPRSASSAGIPELNKQSKSTAKGGAPKSQFSLLKRELKDKMEKNQDNKPKVTANANKGANNNKTNKAAKTDNSKSGNRVEKDKKGSGTKDDGSKDGGTKGSGAKGVLDMAKMFESESDSSRQSSPRDIQIIKDKRSPNAAKKKVKSTSSDA